MTISFKLAPASFSRGFVLVDVPWSPIASSAALEIRNAANYQAAVDSFLAPFIGKVNAQLMVYASGRKFAGFDQAKRTVTLKATVAA